MTKISATSARLTKLWKLAELREERAEGVSIFMANYPRRRRPSRMVFVSMSINAVTVT